MTSTLEEKTKKMKKINKYYIIILLICFILFAVGITTALYSMVASQKKDSTKIHTGTLIINFKDGMEINNPLLIPRYEPNKVADNSNLYKNRFSVESTGSLDQTLNVYLNITSNDISANNLKYKVFNSKGESMKVGTITKTGDTKILENVYLKTKDTADFTLVIWLQETGRPQNEEQDKSLVGTLRVEAIQMQK